MLEAIGEHRRVRLTNVSLRSGQACEHLAYPLRIYISTQSGRQYLLCWHYGLRRMRGGEIPEDVREDYQHHTYYEQKMRQNRISGQVKGSVCFVQLMQPV